MNAHQNGDETCCDHMCAKGVRVQIDWLPPKLPLPPQLKKKKNAKTFQL